MDELPEGHEATHDHAAISAYTAWELLGGLIWAKSY